MQTRSFPGCCLLLLGRSAAFAQQSQPGIDQLLQEPFLDGYYPDVVYGYGIVTDTQNFASRYVGNRLICVCGEPDGDFPAPCGRESHC